MLTERSIWIIAISTLALPLLGVAALLWRRFYREHEGNTARRVFKNSAVPTAMRMLVRMQDLLFSLVFLDLVAPAEAGKYIFAALLIVQYLSTFTDFGLGILLTREAAKTETDRQRLFGITLSLRLLLVLASLPIVGLVIGAYAVLKALGVGEAIAPIGQQALWILTLTLVPAAFSNAVTALYNASERMEVPAAIELVTAIISNMARIAVIVLGFGILGLAWAAVAVTTLTAGMYLWLQQRDFFRPRLVWDRTLIWSIVPLAFPLMLNNLLNAFFFRFDTFILKAYGQSNGDLIVSQYNAAYQVTSIAAIIPSVVTFAVFPLLSRRADTSRAGMAEAQNRTLQMLLLVAFPVAMGISVLAPNFVRFLSGSKASEYLPIAGNTLAVLAWYLPLSFINGLLQYVLIAANQQRSITRAFVIGATFNFVANVALVPFFGMYASATITILSEIVLLLVFLPLLRREGLSPPLLAFTWRPALGALLMGAAMLAMYQLLNPRFGWLGGSIGAGVLAPFVYVLALWLLGTFGAEERALARRVLGRG